MSARTVYKAARRAAWLTQEEAAARIPCSRRALAAYENGAVIPLPDVVAGMAQAYGTIGQKLAAWYCMNECPLGALMLGQLQAAATREGGEAA